LGKTLRTFVSPDQLRESEIRWRIESGQMTAADFDTLTSAEQNVVRHILHGIYANRVSISGALSGLEFAVIAALKLLFTLLNGQALTEQQQAFAATLESLISQHPMPLDPGAWELSYLASQVAQVLQNREEYMQKKLDVTGSF
jgi:hypothetical protein